MFILSRKLILRINSLTVFNIIMSWWNIEKNYYKKKKLITYVHEEFRIYV